MRPTRRFRNRVVAILVAAAVVGSFAVVPYARGDGGSPLMGDYAGSGKKIKKIKFRISGEERVKNLVLVGFEASCNGAYYTFDRTEFTKTVRVRDNKALGTWLMEETFLKGTPLQHTIKVRGYMESRKLRPYAWGLAAVFFNGDRCGPLTRWDAPQT